MSTKAAVSGRDFRAVFFYLIPTVLSNALPLILLPFLTRELSPTDFGLIALAQMFSMVVFAFTHLGLASAFERNYFEYRGTPRLAALVWGSVSFLVVMGFLASVFTYAIYEFVEAWFFRISIPSWFVTLAVFGAHVRGANEISYRFLRNEERAKSFAVISAAEIVVAFLGTLALVIWQRQGIFGYFLGQLISSSFAAVFLAVRVGALQRPSLEFKVLAEAIGLGAPLTFRALLGIASNQLDKYLLALIASIASVGIYSVGQRIAQGVFFVMNAFDFVFIPRIYRMMFDDKNVEAPMEVGRYLTPFVFGSVFVALVAALFSEEALVLLAAPEFRGGVEVAAVLSIGYAVMIFSKVNGRQIMFAKRPRLSVVLALAAIVTTAIICIPAVRLYGLQGAAWGSLAAGLVSGGLMHWQAQKCYRIQWEYRTLAWFFGMLFAFVAVHLALLRIDVPYGLRLGFKVAAVSSLSVYGIKKGYLPFREAFAKMKSVFSPASPRIG